jgi:phage protein D
LQLNEHCDNEAEAMKKAAARVNEENEKAVTIEFTTIGNCDTRLNATNRFKIAGMGRLNGKYFCTSVTHTVSGSSGHKMTVRGYKIFNRL